MVKQKWWYFFSDFCSASWTLGYYTPTDQDCQSAGWTFSVDKVPALVSSRIATGLSGRCLQAFGHRANGADLTSGRPQTARLPDSLHSLPMALQGVGALVSWGIWQWWPYNCLFWPDLLDSAYEQWCINPIIMYKVIFKSYNMYTSKLKYANTMKLEK